MLAILLSPSPGGRLSSAVPKERSDSFMRERWHQSLVKDIGCGFLYRIILLEPLLLLPAISQQRCVVSATRACPQLI